MESLGSMLDQRMGTGSSSSFVFLGRDYKEV